MLAGRRANTVMPRWLTHVKYQTNILFAFVGCSHSGHVWLCSHTTQMLHEHCSSSGFSLGLAEPQWSFKPWWGWKRNMTLHGLGIAVHRHMHSPRQHRERPDEVASVLHLLVDTSLCISWSTGICIPTKMAAQRPTGDLQPQATTAVCLLNITPCLR